MLPLCFSIIYKNQYYPIIHNSTDYNNTPIETTKFRVLNDSKKYDIYC